MTTSSVGAWNEHYAQLEEPEPYSATPTYQLAADWLADCATVEDWGCGKGWMRQFIQPPERYTGVDGSHTPFADVVEDLATRVTTPDGIVLRHVLEHNHEWWLVLDNALSSAQQRLCIVLFTPILETTRVMHLEPDYHNVPVIGFALADLTTRFESFGWEWTVDYVAGGFYGMETVLRLERST